jgi:hypothetical protein
MKTQKTKNPTGTIGGTSQEAEAVAKGQLLFVTYGDENLDEGISYVIELAKAMYEDIVMLLVRKKDSISRKLEDVMASVAFAEAGEHETAKEMATREIDKEPLDYSIKVTELAHQANRAGVRLSAENRDRDLIPAIRSYVKQHTRVNKVVLSPTVTESEILTTRDLSLLVRTASRPIVTMTRKAISDSMQSSNFAESAIAARAKIRAAI